MPTATTDKVISVTARAVARGFARSASTAVGSPPLRRPSLQRTMSVRATPGPRPLPEHERGHDEVAGRVVQSRQRTAAAPPLSDPGGQSRRRDTHLGGDRWWNVRTLVTMACSSPTPTVRMSASRRVHSSTASTRWMARLAVRLVNSSGAGQRPLERRSTQPPASPSTASRPAHPRAGGPRQRGHPDAGSRPGERRVRRSTLVRPATRTTMPGRRRHRRQRRGRGSSPDVPAIDRPGQVQRAGRAGMSRSRRAAAGKALGWCIGTARPSAPGPNTRVVTGRWPSPMPSISRTSETKRCRLPPMWTSSRKVTWTMKSTAPAASR